ncbi:hypothetical protein, partial [Rhodopirellula bahusiensis]|uniref:hypothetical protein n=1 Tax=Rhodopirellula bahusiensis TaxID=2014065 RepID=UPI003297764B
AEGEIVFSLITIGTLPPKIPDDFLCFAIPSQLIRLSVSNSCYVCFPVLNTRSCRYLVFRVKVSADGE